MELLVKPMVNSLVPDPRLTVTDEVIHFIKEFHLARSALCTVQNKENGIITQLMALKFYKALFSLLDKDQELMQELIIVDPVKSCGNILQSLKNRL